MAETKARPGRPKGSGAYDLDAEIDRLIEKQAEKMNQQQEAAAAKVKRATRLATEREQRREQWIEFHRNQSESHRRLSEQHAYQAKMLERDGYAWR